MKLNAGVSTAGWGVFCACSWTWCIGMFLPVVMLGRFGWPGFLVFAIPNVIGCAAFGYVVAQRDRSIELVRSHTLAMRLFSLATIAYHVFFIGFISWLLLPLPDEYAPWIAAAAPPALLSISILLSRLPLRAWPVFAVLVYAGSVWVFSRIGLEPLREIAWNGSDTPGELAWLAVPITFGFLLCPYLDLTFHRALQASPSRHAFAVFGITFAVMIVLTCTYWDVLKMGLTWLIVAHITSQSIFTMSAHVRELRLARATSGNIGWIEDFLPLLALPLAFAGAFSLDALAGSVDVYIRFLVLYGLLFPAYVLIFMRHHGATRTRGRVALYVIAMLALMPLYELGFLHGRAWLAAGGVVILIITTLLMRKQTLHPIESIRKV